MFFWRYLPVGWVPQPTASGCVVTPTVPRGFGFRRAFRALYQALRERRAALHVLGAGLAVTGLLWLCYAGFWVEVAAAVFVAGVYGALAALGEDITAGLRRLSSRLHPRGGDVL
ncbi:hypothetical protein [Streptomyces sp. NPDC006668]|uniref:hypothetical protein n=1 Tax=Streptomyces sp. NPDC006668 TaxID=3156903 RepID=UPI0033EE4A50